MTQPSQYTFILSIPCEGKHLLLSKYDKLSPPPKVAVSQTCLDTEQFHLLTYWDNNF